MDYFNIAFKTTKEYIKAQLIMACITLVILSVGFAILDIPLWFLWAFLLAIADLIPLVGTGIFMIPWAIICFFMGNTHLGGWLLVLYCIAIIIRQVIEPLVVGKKIGLSPLITFLAVLIGGIAFGPVGLILGPIIAAIYKAVLYESSKKQTTSPRRQPPNDDYIDITPPKP